MPTARSSLGTAGEGHARRFLESRGLRWIESNWRCAAGELDLVMAEGDLLVFVEVKTRRGETAGRAEEGISHAKGRRLLAAGEWYVAEHPAHVERIWRIDLVAITLAGDGQVARVTHVENAVVV